MANLTVQAGVYGECSAMHFYPDPRRAIVSHRATLAPTMIVSRVNKLLSERSSHIVTRSINCPISCLHSRNRRRNGAVVCMASTGMGAQQYVASVGAPPPTPPPPTPGIVPANAALLFLGFIACTVTAALSLLLLAAIPALKAIRKAAQSIEKLADTARDELPATMAAVRLSGMEISDLTMELSDLSSEISEGVRSSARAVQAAEDGIRRIGTLASSRTLGMLQTRATSSAEVVRPAVASAARTSRKAIAGARERVAQLSVLKRVMWWLGNIVRQQRKDDVESLRKGAS